MALLPIGVMLAQTDSTRTVKDTKRELRRQRVAKRNLHYNILGGHPISVFWWAVAR